VTQVCRCGRPSWVCRVSRLGMHGSIDGDAQHSGDDVAGLEERGDALVSYL
jgi:hypothetical protein